jgi:hypothetical protein
MSSKTAAQRLAAQRAEQKAKRESSLQEKLARSAAEEAAKVKKKTKKAAETEAALVETKVNNGTKEIDQDTLAQTSSAEHDHAVEKESTLAANRCSIASIGAPEGSTLAEIQEELLAAQATAAASNVALAVKVALLATKDSVIASTEARVEHEARLRTEADNERQAAQTALSELSKTHDVADFRKEAETELAAIKEQAEARETALLEQIGSMEAAAAAAQQSFEEREKALQEELSNASNAHAEALKLVETQAAEIKTASEGAENAAKLIETLRGDLERSSALQSELHLATVGLRNEIDELRKFSTAEREVWQQQSTQETKDDALEKSLKEQLEIAGAQAAEQKATIERQNSEIEEKKAEVEDLRSELDLCMVRRNFVMVNEEALIQNSCYVSAIAIIEIPPRFKLLSCLRLWLSVVAYRAQRHKRCLTSRSLAEHKPRA